MGNSASVVSLCCTLPLKQTACNCKWGLLFPLPSPPFFPVSNKPDGLCGRKAPCLLFTYCKWTVYCHDHLDRHKCVGNGSDRIYRQAGFPPIKQIIVYLTIIPVMDFCCCCSTCQLVDHCKLALSRNLNGVRKYYGVPFMRREQECHVTLILSARISRRESLLSSPADTNLLTDPN